MCGWRHQATGAGSSGKRESSFHVVVAYSTRRKVEVRKFASRGAIVELIIVMAFIAGAEAEHDLIFGGRVALGCD